MTIETQHLRLIPCDVEILRTAVAGNDQLAQALGVSVADKWTEFGIGPLQYSLERLLENPASFGWWTYFPLHRQDNKLVGSGGYKGRPTEDGSVELGYEIAPAYRNQGLATEMTKALVSNAFKDSRVQSIIAHTLGAENASAKVLSKCGFEKVDELIDPEDGPIWKWQLKRPQ